MRPSIRRRRWRRSRYAGRAKIPSRSPTRTRAFYVIGPPHDPKLIRKINPSTSSPETYGIAMNGEGALPLGVISALDSREAGGGQPSPLVDDPKAPFHPRVTIPLGPKGRPWSFDDARSVDGDDWKRIDDFLREHYYGSDDMEAHRRRLARPRDGTGAGAAELHQQHEPRPRARTRRCWQGRRAAVRGRRAGRQLGVLADLAVGEGRAQGHGAGPSEENDLLQGRTPRQPQRHPEGTWRRPDGWR